MSSRRTPIFHHKDNLINNLLPKNSWQVSYLSTHIIKEADQRRKARRTLVGPFFFDPEAALSTQLVYMNEYIRKRKMLIVSNIGIYPPMGGMNAPHACPEKRGGAVIWRDGDEEEGAHCAESGSGSAD
jgi:hypothetical protein